MVKTVKITDILTETPKSLTTAFLIYRNEVCRRFVREKVNLKTIDICKMVKEMWTKVDETTREYYKEIARKQKRDEAQ